MKSFLFKTRKVSALLMFLLLLASSTAFANTYALHLRKVDQQMQIGTAPDAPAYYVQYRTPTTEWQTWTAKSAIPEGINGVWFRAIFETNPEDPMEWELDGDVDQVLASENAIATTDEDIYWHAIGEFDEDGNFTAAYDKNPDPMKALASEPPPITYDQPTKNNQAVATPDPGTAKIFWHNATTTKAGIWHLSDQGITKSVGEVRDAIINGWRVIAVNDFDNDGSPDLLWQNPSTSRLAIWFLEADGFFKSVVLVRDVNLSAWSFVAAADVNNSGRPEIIWQNNTNGSVALWILNEDGTFYSAISVRDINMGAWKIVTIIDVNTDGRPELLWKNASTGRVALWFLKDDGSFDYAVLVRDIDMNAWEIATIANVDGAQRSEIVWKSKSTGRVAVWFLNEDGTYDYPLLVRDFNMTNWDIVGASDVNHNGRDELIWFNPSSGTCALWFLTESGTFDAPLLIRDANMSAWTVADVWQ